MQDQKHERWYPLQSVKGIIFDFNGTLFWDAAENMEAWNITAIHFRGTPFSQAEFDRLNGQTDRMTIHYLKNGAVEENEYGLIEKYKEDVYAKLCKAHNLNLAPGVRKVLSEAKAMDIPIAIASSAPACNMAWYIPTFHLLDFFPPQCIIAGRNDIASKPEPDIFHLAAASMGLTCEECAIFEDSVSGLEAAAKSGSRSLWAVLSPLSRVEQTKTMGTPILSFDNLPASFWALFAK